MMKHEARADVNVNVNVNVNVGGGSMTLESYEAFYDRLDCLPDEALFEASEPADEDEDEREHGYIDEDRDYEP